MEKRFEKSIETLEDGGKLSTWATALACIPRKKLVAVSTTSGDIRFFQATMYKFEHKFSIAWLPSIVVSLDCYMSEKLVCGDFSGHAFVLNMSSDFFSKLHRKALHLGPYIIAFDTIQKGKVKGLQCQYSAKNHFTPIQKVQYIPNLCAVISCSVHTKRAMLIHHLDRNESLSFQSPGGINSFAYCARLNCVATGGVDHSVMIWNPSYNTVHNESLPGHMSSVTHVLVDEKRLFLVSVDRERNLRVWDLLRPTCLQHFRFKDVEIPGRHPFCSAFLDTEMGKLFLTTNRIAVLESRQTSLRLTTHPGSEFIIFVAYNQIFDCIITVGNVFVVALWDPESGSLMFEFTDNHSEIDYDIFENNVDIMAAGLESSQRRLITADRNGKIKVWNFHLGLCLREFHARFTILSLSFIGFQIFAGGFSGTLSVFYDNGMEDVESSDWERLHSGAIISIDYYGRNLVATASSDGDNNLVEKKRRSQVENERFSKRYFGLHSDL
ncbi:WD repeat-containing protein 64-like isoform X2 [Stegodyphus dumicola]|nr:WD repeat-containing protein 64-like isoform X2 [Stegodyphus dumicola]